MKKLILAAAALVWLQTTDAQVKEGKITYEQKIDMYRRIPEDNQQLRAMVPQFRTMKFELLFADNQSLFKGIEEEPDLTNENNNGNVVIRMGGAAENEFYRNFSNKTSIEKKAILENTFLVDDSLRSLTWKLEEGETKIILGYTCKKATGKTARGMDIVAWYSEDISVPSGPDQFNSLPGMILGVDGNKGEFVFTATSFDKKVDKKSIKAPTKGKKVTPAEFAKTQKEIMGDGSGPVRIVTN